MLIKKNSSASGIELDADSLLLKSSSHHIFRQPGLKKNASKKNLKTQTTHLNTGFAVFPSRFKQLCSCLCGTPSVFSVEKLWMCRTVQLDERPRRHHHCFVFVRLVGCKVLQARDQVWSIKSFPPLICLFNNNPRYPGTGR